MVDLSCYTGTGQFGPAYRHMLDHDAHAPGSVDRALTERMVHLCDETASVLYGTVPELVVGFGDLATPNDYAKRTTAGCRSVEGRVQAIAEFTAGMGASVDWEDLDAIRLGRTEEEIIVRGSDWCTDVARVACALCQMNGIPARLVYLFDILRAYSGHAIIEAYRSAVWGAADSSTAVVYRHPDRRPASAWELIQDPEVVDHHRRPGATYTKANQFRGAAISDYFLWERGKYKYTVSGISHYYRSILEMSDRDWPGGLRWLHGEDTHDNHGNA